MGAWRRRSPRIPGIVRAGFIDLLTTSLEGKIREESIDSILNRENRKSHRGMKY